MGGHYNHLGYVARLEIKDGQRDGLNLRAIARKLGRMDPAERPGTMCHESIFCGLYALPRGELRRDLLAALCQGRQNRRPRSRGARRQGFITDDIKIARRPEEIDED